MARRRSRKSEPKKNGIVRIDRFESVQDFAHNIEYGTIQEEWRYSSLFKNSEDYLKRWCGETPEKAIEKLRLGDAEKAEKIKAQGDILNEKYGGFAPKIEVGVYGCIPSVPNYLRGVPANMMRVVRQPRRNPVIDMYVESSIYDGIDVDKVAEKAAIIANCITKTEMEGVRVNLYVVNTANDHDDGNTYATCVKVKDAQAPLNLLNIAFAVTNRAMCRSCFLKWLEQNVNKSISGHGYPMRGDEAREALKLDGVLLSIRDMVDKNLGIESVVNEINKYLKN